jgi:hypothetical protein|tara:strand:- start:3635 stop:3793 length:159 start_codon:yes stop_codon:yes gene_type:complete
MKLEANDVNWILKVIKESSCLRGEDLSQAVATITKLQELIKKEKKNGEVKSK